MKEPFVFSARSGLSNRLRAMVGVRALAQMNEAPCLIHWEKHGSCFAEFQDLYDLNGWDHTKLISKKEAEWYKANTPERYFHTADWFTDIWETAPVRGANLESYCRHAIESLRGLQPPRTIRSLVDDFAGLNRVDECIGIHIRLTDNVHAYEVWKQSDPHFRIEKISSLDGFRAAIRQLESQGERVFLSTDNAQVADQLCSEFGDIIRYEQAYDNQGHVRHINSHYGKSNVFGRFTGKLMRRFAHDEPESWRTTSIQDALIDLMLLSRCRRIIGTYYSSFSQISALIGGKPLSIQSGQSLAEDTFISRLNQLATR